jgi:hypothetical protein
MAIDFPNSPIDNQEYTVGDTTWYWSAAGTVWNIKSTYIGYTPTLYGGQPNSNYGGIASLNAGGVIP